METEVRECMFDGHGNTQMSWICLRSSFWIVMVIGKNALSLGS